MPVIRGKKRGEEREGGRNLEPASPSRHGDVSLHNRSCLPGGTGPCPHGQLLPRGGHSPARRPLLRLSSPAAGKGLTPSSCSPDAGSGIHICVIINLGESAAAGGWLCPPSLPTRSQRAAAKGWLERGGSPGAAGSSRRTPSEMNWGPPRSRPAFHGTSRFPYCSPPPCWDIPRDPGGRSRAGPPERGRTGV